MIIERPERNTTLPLVLLKYLLWPFLSAIIPRLFLIVFRYSQAILINATIRFVGQNNGMKDQLPNTSAWLVIVGVVIYVGMAVSAFSDIC